MWNVCCRLLITFHEPTTATDQLVWLLYISGSLIGAKAGGSNSDNEDLIDGDLTCRCFEPAALRAHGSCLSYRILEVINAVDGHFAQRASSRSELLDQSFIYFFQRFRVFAYIFILYFVHKTLLRTYIGDQVHKSIRVFTRLNESLGLKDDAMIISVFARKIVDMLEYWVKRSVEPSLIAASKNDIGAAIALLKPRSSCFLTCVVASRLCASTCCAFHDTCN